MMQQQIAQLQMEKSNSANAVVVTLRCAGPWLVPAIAQLEPQLQLVVAINAAQVQVDATQLVAMDTSGAWLLQRTIRALERRGLTVSISGLRPEFSALLQLVAAAGVAPLAMLVPTTGILAKVGKAAWLGLLQLRAILAFIGKCSLILLHSVLQPRRIRWRHVLHNLQSAGFEALPITGLLSFLMGVVIAYQGADQLQRFGANIFIVELVALAMLRELAPLMTAIIVAGRSGSSYAAQIGSMKVTEEIDALRTIGIGPIELLVLPKMLALMIALPLLTVFADISGVLGGMLMASSKLDVSVDVFLHRIGDVVSLSSFLTGVGKAPIFAAIISLVGCYQGFQASGSADSVGRQTTVSVVQSIFLVILADALFSVVFNWLKL